MSQETWVLEAYIHTAHTHMTFIWALLYTILIYLYIGKGHTGITCNACFSATTHWACFIYLVIYFHAHYIAAHMHAIVLFTTCWAGDWKTGGESVSQPRKLDTFSEVRVTCHLFNRLMNNRKKAPFSYHTHINEEAILSKRCFIK